MKSLQLLYLAFLCMAGLSFSLTSVPGCMAVSTADTYSLSANLTGANNSISGFTACIAITASDAILDCNGHSIINNGTSPVTAGIAVASASNVTILNCPNISLYTYGIALHNSNGTLYNNSLYNNSDATMSSSDIYLDAVSGLNVTGNVICNTTDNGRVGIYAASSVSNSVFYNNTFCSDYLGVYDSFGSLSSNTFADNLLYSCSRGFYLRSSLNNSFSGNNFTSGGSAFFLDSGSNNNTFTGNYLYLPGAFGFYLFSGSGNIILNNTVQGSSTSGIYLESAASNNFTDNTVFGSAVYGFYINSGSATDNIFTGNTVFSNADSGFFAFSSCRNNNFSQNSVYGNGYGFQIRQCNNNTLYGNTVRGNSIYGIWLRSSANYNNLSNNTVYNNNASGVFLNGVNYNFLFGNTAYAHTANSGFSLASSSNNTLVSNTAYNNTYGFSLATSSNNNTLTTNLAYNNTYNFYIYNSSGTVIQSGFSFPSTMSANGAYVFNSNNTVFNNGHYFNNTASLNVSAAVPSSISINNAIFDNPQGNFANFTNLSLSDVVTAGTGYQILWTQAPAATLPVGYASFAQKYINISVISGAPSLDSVTWTWTTAELGGHNESAFSLWKYNGTWQQLNGTPGGHALSASAISSFSTFGILEFNDTTPPTVTLLSPANNTPVYTSTVTFNFTAADDSSAIMDCTLFFDGTANQTDPAVPNDTATGLTVGGIQLGNHNWSVSCTDASNNTGASEMRRISRASPPTPPSPPPSPPPPPPECSVDADCSASQVCSAGSCIQVSCACGAVQDHQCVPYACCLDSQCAGGESCQDHACTAVSCSCGIVQDHQCVQYACCQASDCGAGQSCQDHACITTPPVTPPVTPGGNRPPPVPGAVCNTSDQCTPEQYCNNGACSDVTGKCGHAVGHAWVAYACGSEQGCPSCQAGSDCSAHSCEPRLTIAAPGSAFVGEGAKITVTEGGSTCRSCGVSWTSPSGKAGSGTTDSAGVYTLPLSEQGAYKVALVKDPTKTATVNSLAKPSSIETQPAVVVLIQAVSSPLTWLVVVLALAAGLVLYLSRRAAK